MLNFLTMYNKRLVFNICGKKQKLSSAFLYSGFFPDLGHRIIKIPNRDIGFFNRKILFDFLGIIFEGGKDFKSSPREINQLVRGV